ncbi:cation transport ATPase [Rhizobium ruizarguesonis]
MPETVALPEASEAGISALIQRIWPLSLAAIAISGLIAGGLLRWWHAGLLFWSTTALVSATVIVMVALSVDVAVSLRRGDIGLDLIAALSMSAALWFGEYFAGAIVAVMYAGGQFLESFAQRRAESGMSELLSRAPRRAVRITATGLSEVPIAALLPGDRLLVRKGDVVPVDGKVIAGHALLNEAALTGESLPVRRGSGELIMSGSSNLGDAFEMIASGSANEST